MIVDYIRQIRALKNFKLEDKFEFEEFDDITPEGLTETEPVPEHIEIWAAIQIPFEGTLPESYKVLNLIIGDWVGQHEKELTMIIHGKLKEHFKANYPNSDTSEMDEDSAIWTDQLDFMPRINEKEKNMIVEIELVLEAEQQD
jgi:hypothetical protein